MREILHTFDRAEAPPSARRRAWWRLKGVGRGVILALWLLPALALGQAAKEEDENKVSNDQPGRPLQMPPASTEAKEAFDDFERFQRRGAWERALKSLSSIPDDQTQRFVDGENGFIVPVARRRHAVLAALPAEGQAAYRLFHDAEAKKLLDEAEGASELKNLERVYSGYFLSSVGDNAADRLGDLYFELGRFDRAADCWLAVLRERPDTDLAPGLVAVKAALALARAGRRSELEQVRSDLAERYADERVSVGGTKGRPAEVLRRLLGSESGSEGADGPATGEGRSPGRGVPAEADWQVRLAESIEAGMTPAELSQWESNPLSVAVPAVAVEGGRLFVNYLGYTFAVDLESGKLLWRSGAFHQLKLLAMQDHVRMVDTGRFAVAASGEHVWTLGRDLKDANFLAPYRLACRRAAGGELVWQSGDLPDYAQVDLVGPPLLADGKLFVPGKTLGNQPNQQQQPQQFVLAVRPHDGKVLWKTEVGAFRQAQQFFFYYGNSEPAARPQLLYRAGAVYVDTHVGVFARLDADTGALDWGFGYPTDAAQGQSRFFFAFEYNQPREPATAPSPPVPSGEALVIKGMQSGRLVALDPSRMKVLWERPIAKSTRLLGVDRRAVYLGGPELGALDPQTRALRWSARLPGGSGEGRVLLGVGEIWQLTPRGIFEIDAETGDVRRIFRGQDLGAAGGDLVTAGHRLLAVSNRTITAYPLRPAGAAASAGAASPHHDEGSE